MRAMKLILPAAFLMTGFLVCTTASYGTAAYAKKEKDAGRPSACTTCHAKMVADKAEMAKNLNDAGKEYQKTLPPKK